MFGIDDAALAALMATLTTMAEGTAAAGTAAAGTAGALGAGAAAAEGAGMLGAGGMLAAEGAGGLSTLAELPVAGSITESALGTGSEMALGNAAGMNLPAGLETLGETGSWLDTLGPQGYGGPAEGGGIMTPLEGITGEAPIGTYGQMGWKPQVSLSQATSAGRFGKSLYDEMNKPPQKAPDLPAAPPRKQMTPVNRDVNGIQRFLATLPPELREQYRQLLLGS